MRIERVMAKPSPATFTMAPVRRLLNRVVGTGEGWVDPAAGWHSPAEHTNDLNPLAPATSHEDALAFLARFKDRSVKGVLLDPPYSPRQMKECYENVGRAMLKEDGLSSFWAGLKNEAARIIEPGGRAITFGWNSVGLGRSRKFVLEEVHLFPTGGMHNDTIATVERRANGSLGAFHGGA